MKVGCSVGSPDRRRPPSPYGETAVAAGAVEDLSERSRASAPEPSGRSRPQTGRAPRPDQDRAPAPVLPREDLPRTASSPRRLKRPRPNPHRLSFLTRAPARRPPRRRCARAPPRRPVLFPHQSASASAFAVSWAARPCSRRASGFWGRRPSARASRPCPCSVFDRRTNHHHQRSRRPARLRSSAPPVASTISC